MFYLLGKLGAYIRFLISLVTNREPARVYPSLIVYEMYTIGIESLFLVSIVSLFIGAVSCVQSANNLFNPLIPKYIIGTITRDLSILELSTTFTCVVLAGKIGSHIASGLGTMRISEQIDALEVMGINSASFLVLPKVIAGITMFPILVILAAFLELLGGYIAGVYSGLLTPHDYIYGIRTQFDIYNVWFALTKSVTFGFIITSVSAYQGYYTRGGSLEVGQASTQAVTKSCIYLLLADYFIAQLFL